MPYFHGMFVDSTNGTLSSRRIIAFSAFVLCAIAFIANMFFGMKIDQFIFDSMAYIAMAGMGATVAEKFATKNTYEPYNNYNNNYDNHYQQPMNGRNRGTPLPPQNSPQI